MDYVTANGVRNGLRVVHDPRRWTVLQFTGVVISGVRGGSRGGGGGGGGGGPGGQDPPLLGDPQTS